MLPAEFPCWRSRRRKDVPASVDKYSIQSEGSGQPSREATALCWRPLCAFPIGIN